MKWLIILTYSLTLDSYESEEQRTTRQNDYYNG